MLTRKMVTRWVAGGWWIVGGLLAVTNHQLSLLRRVSLFERSQDLIHHDLNLGVRERSVRCPERETQREAHLAFRYALPLVAIEFTNLHEDCGRRITNRRAHGLGGKRRLDEDGDVARDRRIARQRLDAAFF